MFGSRSIPYIQNAILEHKHNMVEACPWRTSRNNCDLDWWSVVVAAASPPCSPSVSRFASRIAPRSTPASLPRSKRKTHQGVAECDHRQNRKKYGTKFSIPVLYCSQPTAVACGASARQTGLDGNIVRASQAVRDRRRELTPLRQPGQKAPPVRGLLFFVPDQCSIHIAGLRCTECRCHHAAHLPENSGDNSDSTARDRAGRHWTE